MRRKLLKKLNNQGSTLVMVVVCMLFVGIIASLILSITMHNLDESQISKNSKENFYSAENVVDELQSILDEYANEAVKEAYTTWLTSYSVLNSPSAQEAAFQGAFADTLYGYFSGLFGENGSLKNKGGDVFYSFSGYNPENPDAPYVIFPTESVSVFKTADADGVPCVILKGVQVTYKDESGMASTITTDMKYKVRYPGFSANTSSGTNYAVADFVLIADEQVTSGTEFYGNISGSIYGGGYNSGKYDRDGIVFNGSNSVHRTININAKNILTRTSIKLAKNADLRVKGYYSYLNSNDMCDIWASNIKLGNDVNPDSVSMNVVGNCYISDDLTLESDSSSFTLTGQYFGYNTTNGNAADKDWSGTLLRTGTAKGSSAIVINGARAKLDMLNASKIWIAGKTFVSVGNVGKSTDSGLYDKAGADANSVLNSADDVNFIQGESISYRGLQSAYLVPGECILNIGHNPVSEADYIKLVKDMKKVSDGLLKPSDPEYSSRYAVDISQSRRSGKIRLEDYVQSAVPYRAAVVKYGNGENMVYLYLNFQNADKASEYFKHYSELNPELVTSKMKSFDSGQILMNISALETTGNTVLYDGGYLGTAGSTYSYNDAAVENRQIELSNSFSGLVTTLYSDRVGDAAEGRLTDSLVDLGKIPSGQPQTVTVITGDSALNNPTKSYYIVTGDNIVINGDTPECQYSRGAVVIAKNNVHVNAGASFKGLIIAGGTITVDGGGQLSSDSENVEYVIANRPEASEYFNLKAGEGSGRNVYAAELFSVEFINWKKN